ncbi:GTP cyclohydrolase FolE2 [Dyella humicola]|uniref:GTP cyclohydrolase FolE2 n=1 Tax=Dyella humicola TaxID=2992126 RepID=UPI003CE4D21F
MKGTQRAIPPLPEVTVPAPVALEILPHWAGVEGIDLPLSFDAGDGDLQRSRAKVDAFVGLACGKPRGIRRSRLYRLLDRHLGGKIIDGEVLEHLLSALMQAHVDVADRARISIRFEHLVRRAALRSDNRGWRAYPVLIEATRGIQGFRLVLGTEVTYSSTCPASAALSRQLIQQQFADDFDPKSQLDHATVMAWLGSERGILATPHAQRSTARLRVRFVDGAPIKLIDLLDRAEQALGTPVQTAVKREDEQAFAHANGSNLMFCEDAARRIQNALLLDESIADFSIRIAHHESLHAHDAVAYANRPDGLAPLL